ncbi:MAG TPA: hypothetical protein VIJ82_21935 [Streptosporangiaceae bacterium]|jgi:hypothetical protein
MGFMDAIAVHRGDPEQGRTLAEVMSGAGRPDRNQAEPDRPDADEVSAGLLARGYTAGGVSALAQKLANAEADLATERARIGKTAKRQEWIQRAHAAGQISAFDIAAMQDEDEGDEARAGSLARRCDSLRLQLREVSDVIAAPQRAADPLEAAASRAHAAFASATRSAMAAAEARPEPPPFAGRGAAVPGDDPPAMPGSLYRRPDALEIARSLGPAEGCTHCRNIGVTAAQSVRIHAGAV